DAAIGADLAADLGVRLTDLDEHTLSRLRDALPEGATAANPLDHTAMLWADEPALAQVTEVIASDPLVGHLLYVQDEPEGLTADAAQEWLITREGALIGARRAGQVPMLVATTPGQAPAGAVAGLGNSLRAIRALQQPAPDPQRLRQIRDAAGSFRPAGRPDLDEHRAKQLAARHGIAVPDGDSATNANDAVRIAEGLGWPVVLKALGPAFAHKSEMGAVVVGLDTSAQVHTVAERLLRMAPQVLVERQIPTGVEVLIAARRAGVIPTLTVGLGGIWTESLRDLAVVPLPATSARIRTALAGLAAAPLLTGARGQASVDLEALCLLAQRIGDLLLAEQLTLVEANPVILGPSSAVAVDLLIHSS
ncbi:MAG: acetate--CoA ligase family protein, partial [Actinomycetales bacterium]